MAKKKVKKDFPKIHLKTATFEEVENYVKSDFFQNTIKRIVEGEHFCPSGSCSECPFKSDKVYDKSESSVTCQVALAYVLSIYLQFKNEFTSEENPQKTPSEDNSLNYKDTRNFMKERGYTHCYMCGGEL